MPGNAQSRRRAGFTLLEVMIALAVVSLGMLAAFGSINQVATQASYLRDKTFADWIAMNHVTELRLAEAWPDTGDRDGDAEFAGLDWRWSEEVSQTEVENLRRVEVSVMRDDAPEKVLAKLAAFIGRPFPGQGSPSDWTGGGPGDSGEPGQRGAPNERQNPDNNR